MDVTNKYIGDLHFSKSGMPILIIGIHVLHGKEMELSKPFAVLTKKNNEVIDNTGTSEKKNGIYCYSNRKKEINF